MADLLLNLGGNKAARGVMSTIGIPVPPQLRRAVGPWVERPLEGRIVLVGGTGALHETLAPVLARAGASVGTDDGIEQGVYRDAADAWARPLVRWEDSACHAMVFDGTGLERAADLRQLYDFFHPRIRGLNRNGRVVVLGRDPSSASTPEGAATASALDGFVRSLAKEVGRKGSTVNLLRVDADAHDRLEPVLRFLLSDRSVYIDGQPLHVTALCAGQLPEWTPRILSGRVVLVTGAAQGIGRATARRLALEGAKVVVLDRPSEDRALAELAREIGGVPLPVDITDDDAPQRIVALLSSLGALAAVVHNAGVTRDKTLGRMDEERWDLLMDVNLAAILRIQEALEAGPLLDGGRVVFLSSIAGLAGNPGQTNYAASKAAVAGLARALGPALASRGIGVHAVAPGFIETRMTAAIPFGTREAGRRLSNLSQGGLPADVAEVLTFLASPYALGLTGGVLRVCGGSLIGA
jgi:3-oxoacyl-[acyl-carrier protein] reductase